MGVGVGKIRERKTEFISRFSARGSKIKFITQRKEKGNIFGQHLKKEIWGSKDT